MASRLWLWSAADTQAHDLQLDEALAEFVAWYLPSEARRICNLKRRISRIQSLLSHLLQRHACSALAKLRPDQIRIKRTRGGKPFAAVDPAAHCPNFNFNASHDGEYVVLAASTHFLTGVDVHKMLANPKFGSVVVSRAQEAQAAGMDSDQWRIWMQVLFSAKEAYTKAVGVGLGQSYKLIEFDPPLPSAWAEPSAFGLTSSGVIIVESWKGRVLHLDEAGSNRTDQGEWCLELQWVDANHIVITAMGDVAWAVDEDGDFASRLTKPGLSPVSAGPARSCLFGSAKPCHQGGSCGVARPLCLFELLSPAELAFLANPDEASRSLAHALELDSCYTDSNPCSPDPHHAD